MGSVSLSIFTSSSEPPIYIPTHNEITYHSLGSMASHIYCQKSKGVIRVKRERWGPLNPMRRDDGTAHQQRPYYHWAQRLKR
ncbi:hypothetical protein Gohar_025216 [Gossypium harknessii]|uniref:Uncharacterized protein n=1 Tax=Gossypium harknessii TaxID=34285 RepID=A0A7J9HIK1_9ROSI|nr:hypothetical protein [Gossypium harknessii]